MPAINAIKNGNWSDATVWDLGRPPQAGDDVNLGSYVVALDVARAPTAGSLNSLADNGGYVP